MFKVPEQHRLLEPHPMGTKPREGNYGVFVFHYKHKSGKTPAQSMQCIASDGGRWEHVSVSIMSDQGPIMPDWEAMCYVKDLFWDETDVVMQLHPAKKNYVNNHNFVLHLWRPMDTEIPTPPIEFV